MLIKKISAKFSLVYFSIFIVIGINAPFFPLWLSSKGFTERYIAIILATSVLTKLLANPFFAGLGDKYGNRKIPMLYLSFISTIILFSLNIFNSLYLIAFMAITSWALFAPLMPLTESLTTTAIKKYNFDYGNTRLWGSVSFIIIAFFGGIIIEKYGLKYVPILMTIGALFLFLSIIIMPTIPSLPARKKFSTYALLKNRNFFPFLLACGAIQSSHGIYYGFSTIYWKSIGLSETVIGALWAEGVVFEIILLAYFYKFKNYTSPKIFIIIAGVMAIIRWTLMAYADTILFIALIQILHAFTFGLTHLAAINFISEVMPVRAQAKSQALYSAISMGAFLAVSISVSGDLYRIFYDKSFLFSSFLAFSGVIISLIFIKTKKTL
ncbi:MAG: MFS transporter [Alphaproteobacteria bacterium]|jgi:PPP family 3-phenylpropionic acid transporter|nr:MFS transporter [Alphaproteobacteria bacterium]|tara:strand:+ start:3461 stop:4603 length:1143 start_codon:yes stop_codon:yes gene_type:complete